MVKRARLMDMHCAQCMKGRTVLFVGLFLDHMYENCIPDNPGIEEVVWTDGPSSESKINEN